MNPQCVVDQASIKDLPRLVELLSEGVAGPGECSTLAEGVRYAMDQPAPGGVFVVREQGRILAMATVTTTVSTAEGGRVAMLGDFVVERTRRNEGIGSQLLEGVRSHAAAQSLLRITVMPEGLSNSARCFFGNRGFTGSKMIAMRLSLAVPHAG